MVELEEEMGLWRVNLMVEGERWRSSPGKQGEQHFGCQTFGVKPPQI